MTTPPSPPMARDYARLFRAMNDVLAALSTEGHEEDALRLSFEAAAEGFRAQKALLLLVKDRDPLLLTCLHALGDLSRSQIAACEKGESVKGVSATVIRQVIDTRRAELIQDPRLHAAGSRTSSFEGGRFSVLCAPVLDPLRNVALAVLYFQNAGLAEAYEGSDLAWLEGYTGAVGRAFGVHFASERREQELAALLEATERPERAPELIGDSAHVQALRRELHQVHVPVLSSSRPDPILILGERGTGKDLVARYLHAYSGRASRPFVVVNCAEVTDELASSRFFGHKKGAFTGALADEPGAFRAAQGGVLFLDEIGDLSPRAQACLLRVLENHTVAPVGETREVPVDVAVVLATNRDLEEAVAAGGLRADFYDRFRAHVIKILPLRERPWDVPPLLEHFRLHHEGRIRKWTLGFTQEALRALVVYPWPGNVREVARVCSVLVSHATPGAQIDRDLLERCCPDVIRPKPNPKAGAPLWEGTSFEEAVEGFQRELILARLERHGGNVRLARESLHMTRSTFHRYMQALGITPEKPEA